MNARDWRMLGSGALVAAAAVVAIYETKATLVSAEQSPRSTAAARASESDRAEPENAALSLKAPAPIASREASTPAREPGAARQVEDLRQRLADVQRQKRDLETELRSVEQELARRPEQKPGDDRDEFELDREDWKELAASGRIKYRIPCLLPSNAAYQIPPDELDALGLSPDDGKLLVEAQRRSNARIWSVVQPLCVEAVGTAEIAELLGPQNCLNLIEKQSAQKDPNAYWEARRQVAEVHAGMRPAPSADQPQHPVFLAQLALTSESHLFQSDLAESFGPDEAKRVARSMRCTATVR